MRSATDTLRSLRLGAIAIAVVALVAPASAQWTQVPGATASDVFSVSTNGDPIVAGADAFDSQPQTTAIAAGGSRLLACSGVNGSVFFRDPGQADWTLSLLLNDRFAAGLTAESAAWNGRGWVVGSNIGVFHSATGQSPWTFVDFGLRPLFFTAVVTRGADFFVSLGAADGTLIA